MTYCKSKPVWNGFQTISAPLHAISHWYAISDYVHGSISNFYHVATFSYSHHSLTLSDSLRLIETHWDSLRLIETHWDSLRLIRSTLRIMTMRSIIIKSLFLKRSAASLRERLKKSLISLSIYLNVNLIKNWKVWIKRFRKLTPEMTFPKV